MVCGAITAAPRRSRLDQPSRAYFWLCEDHRIYGRFLQRNLVLNPDSSFEAAWSNFSVLHRLWMQLFKPKPAFTGASNRFMLFMSRAKTALGATEQRLYPSISWLFLSDIRQDRCALNVFILLVTANSYNSACVAVSDWPDEGSDWSILSNLVEMTPVCSGDKRASK